MRGSALLGFLMRHGAPIVLYLPARATPTTAAKANDFISLVLSNKVNNIRLNCNESIKTW